MVATHADCSDPACAAAFEVLAADSKSLASATCCFCGSFLREALLLGREGPQLDTERVLAPGEVVVETLIRPAVNW